MANKEAIKKFVLHDRHGHEIDFSSFAVVGEVEVSIGDGIGEPTAESTYEGGKLTINIDNIKGDGIASIEQTPSTEDGGVNIVTITCESGATYHLQILNGSKGERGNGIASITEQVSDQDGGINTVTITDDDGQTHNIHTRNGRIGIPGESAVFDPQTGNIATMKQTTGSSITDPMSQNAVTQAIDNHNDIDNYKYDLSTHANDGAFVAALFDMRCEYGETYILYHKTSGTKWTHHVYLQNVKDQAQASILQDVDFTASAGYETAEFTCNVEGGTNYIRLQAVSNGAELSVIDTVIVKKGTVVHNLLKNTEDIATNAENIATNAENIVTNTENIATNAADIKVIKNNIGDNAYEFSLPITGDDGTVMANLHDYRCEYGKTYNVYHKSVGKWTHHVCLQNKKDQAQASVLQDVTFRNSDGYEVTEFTCEVEGGTNYIKMQAVSSSTVGTFDIMIAEKGSMLDKMLELEANGIDTSEIEAEIDAVRKGDYGSNIFDVNKKQYYKNLFIQANWASRDGGNTPHISPLVMLWFSDIHGAAYNYARLIEFRSYFAQYIQDTLCTGDLVNDRYQDDFTYFTDNDILLAIGNHDVQDRATGELSHYGIDAYNKYFAPFVDNWGVVQPDNAAEEGLCYYYKDYTERGIRLIVLDKLGWNAAQNEWLQGVLTDAKSKGLAVICANHYPASNTTLERSCSFCTLYTKAIGGMPDEAIASIQSFIDNEHGEFICHLSGHTHADYYGVIQGTTQLSITIDCAYSAYDAWNDSDRVTGQKSADCFNILSFDTYDKTIKVFRVGVDRDRWLRHKGTMCVKYDTREILWND